MIDPINLLQEQLQIRHEIKLDTKRQLGERHVCNNFGEV